MNPYIAGIDSRTRAWFSKTRTWGSIYRSFPRARSHKITSRVNICIEYIAFSSSKIYKLGNMTLSAVFKMHPLVLVLENRALGILVICVVYILLLPAQLPSHPATPAMECMVSQLQQLQLSCHLSLQLLQCNVWCPVTAVLRKFKRSACFLYLSKCRSDLNRWLSEHLSNKATCSFIEV